jgi:hypothetical protein
VRVAVLGVTEELQERVAIIDDPARDSQLALLVDDGDVRAFAMQVDADPC